DLGMLLEALGREGALVVRRPVRMRRELAEALTDRRLLEQPSRVVLLGVDGLVLPGLRGGDEGLEVAVREGVDHQGREVAVLPGLVVAALLAGPVPRPLRLVDRAEDAEVDALLVAEVPDHVEQVAGELLVVLRG